MSGPKRRRWFSLSLRTLLIGMTLLSVLFAWFLHHRREKVAENTIVVYVTDNGWIQNLDAPKYAPKSKQSQYDGGLRTPIMVRWPAKIRPAMSDAAVSSLDILPTLLDATGIARPDGLLGVSLTDSVAVNAREAESCSVGVVRFAASACSAVRQASTVSLAASAQSITSW